MDGYAAGGVKGNDSFIENFQRKVVIAKSSIRLYNKYIKVAKGRILCRPLAENVSQGTHIRMIREGDHYQ